MTNERAEAYGRVMRHIADLEASKLQPAERERIREAADTLLFCEDPLAPEAVDAIHDIEALIEHLVTAERFTEGRAQRLLDDVSACGPLAHVA